MEKQTLIASRKKEKEIKLIKHIFSELVWYLENSFKLSGVWLVTVPFCSKKCLRKLSVEDMC